MQSTGSHFRMSGHQDLLISLPLVALGSLTPFMDTLLVDWPWLLRDIIAPALAVTLLVLQITVTLRKLREKE